MTDSPATRETRRGVRLVVADVDGTLLTPGKVLTPRARAAVQAVIEAGIAFTITSVVGTINDTVRTRGTCSLVLSGGSTPRTLCRLLASQFRTEIPWAHVQVFWGDERYVPPEDSRSNYRMAKEALLDDVSCPPGNIHPMPTHSPTADVAARDYERTLRNHFVGESPHFDIVLLGIGDDGHTASLFPGSLALAERTRWVVAAQAPVAPQMRLTLTLPALTGAAVVHVLVAGATKAEPLRQVLDAAGDWIKYPAAGVRRGTGSVIWWADRDAAALAHDIGDSR
jgi:6-phosphogluconolactonase